MSRSHLLAGQDAIHGGPAQARAFREFARLLPANGYLATLRDGGLVGLILLSGAFGTALYQAVKILRERGERIYLALLLYGMTCIFMDFDRLFVQPKEMWLYLWLPLANAEVRVGLGANMGPVRILPDGTLDLSGFDS